MILDANHKTGARQSGGRIAMFPPPEIRMLSGVKPAISQRNRQVIHIAKIGIISGAFAGEYGMQRMMKVIAPLR
ncbi:MAG TPA: hypothetical protein VHT31_06310, partial [Candidatus Acidoferrum sp.]|nr:hypothetical protein [Candidatus Acidoferrum sp.]